MTAWPRRAKTCVSLACGCRKPIPFSEILRAIERKSHGHAVLLLSGHKTSGTLTGERQNNHCYSLVPFYLFCWWCCTQFERQPGSMTLVVLAKWLRVLLVLESLIRCWQALATIHWKDYVWWCRREKDCVHTWIVHGLDVCGFHQHPQSISLYHREPVHYAALLRTRAKSRKSECVVGCDDSYRFKYRHCIGRSVLINSLGSLSQEERPHELNTSDWNISMISEQPQA